MNQKVSALVLSAIAAVVRSKAAGIKRPILEGIDDNEIKVERFFNGAKCICRIRGMSYCVCIDANKPSLATFEPTAGFLSENGCRVIGHGGAGHIHRD